MQEFIKEINWELPKISTRRIYTVLMSIKGRLKKYKTIWLGRRDWPKFNISERQMPKLINLLIDTWHLIEKWHTRGSRWFSCRVYELSDYLKRELANLKDYVKAKFEYINPVEYVKARFAYKIKYGRIKFEVDWNKYMIALRGKYKNVIYDCTNNNIINPLKLWKQY